VLARPKAAIHSIKCPSMDPCILANIILMRYVNGVKTFYVIGQYGVQTPSMQQKSRRLKAFNRAAKA